MSSLPSYTISNASPTNLRAGIKWDALERDDIEDACGVTSPSDAREEHAAIKSQLCSLTIADALLKPLFFLHSFLFMQRLCKRNSDRRNSFMARQKILNKYLDQDALSSYDLDLCCFCYDNRGTLLLAVFPNVTEGIIDPKTHAAFVHTGDDITGTSETYDEELQVNLPTVSNLICSIYFVTVSNNHGFNKIKGGFWSINSTSEEKELLSASLHTQTDDRVNVMAKLTRGDDAWQLDEVSDYYQLDPAENISLSDKINHLLKDRYLK